MDAMNGEISFGQMPFQKMENVIVAFKILPDWDKSSIGFQFVSIIKID